MSDYIGNFIVNSDDSESGNLPYVYTPNLVFLLKKPVHGSFNFSMETTATIKNSAELLGRLVLNLDFVKLKADKPQKVY